MIGVSTTEDGHAAASGPGRRALRTSPALDRVAQVLRDRFEFEVVGCAGEQATRAGIIEALDAWIASCEAEAAEVCLLYYFGHGGRTQFTGVPGGPEQEFGYVTCRRVEPIDGEGQRPFEGVLGLELSVKLSALARSPGRSVTAILDCCYAGQQVRAGRPAGGRKRVAAPEWVQDLLAQGHDGLAVDSHPTLVRLAGSTASGHGHIRPGRRGDMGHMTEALLRTIEEFGEDCSRLTWDAVARRVRQRAIDEVREAQWVSFAGPREQLLFSPTIAIIPRTVGLAVHGEHPRRAWLRVGGLQGVAAGDRWAVTSACVGPSGRTEALAIGVVVELERNRAQLEFAEGTDVDALRSNAAELLAAHDRIAVQADDEGLRERLGRSPWLRVADEQRGVWMIGARGSELVIDDRSGQWPSCRWPASDPGEVVDLLEDRARSTRLLEALPALARAPDRGHHAELPVTWTWGAGAEPLPQAGATVFADDRIWIRVKSREARARHWFVNIIYIDPLGRPWQLNTRLPQGLEFAHGDQEELGLRVGAAQQGLGLPGVERLDRCAARRAKLIVLATTLPLELGHLLRTADGPGADAFAMQGLRPPGTRERGRWGRCPPDLVDRWAYEVVDFELCLGGRVGAGG